MVVKKYMPTKAVLNAGSTCKCCFVSISATHIFLVCLDNKFISNTEQPKELKQY